MRITKPSLARQPRAARCALALALASVSTAPNAFAQHAAPGAVPPPVTAATPGAVPLPSSAATPAHAETGATTAAPTDHAARGVELRRRGNRAADEGRFADALADYEEAAKLAPEPKNFYNLATTYQKIGRNADALAWFLRFKAGASRDELEKVPNLDTRIATLRNKVAFLKVNVNVAGARVLVRDAVVGTKPVDRPLEVSLNEGKAQVEIISEGYQPYRKDHTLLGGSSLEIDVQLNRETPPTNIVEKTKTVYITATPFWSQWWFWAGASVLVVGGATTVYALSSEKTPTSGSLGQITGPLSSRLSGLGLRF